MGNLFLTQYDGAILGPIAKLLGLILNGIYYVLDQTAKFMFGGDSMGNAGLCIVIFTFIVNAIMIPLTIKQQKFSKLTSVMQPELAAIQKKYNGKRDEASIRRMQLEQQEVYQKYGTSPTGGCLPLLISLPIILALYRVVQNVPAYVDAIKSIYDSAASAIDGSQNCIDVLVNYIAGHDGAGEFAVSVQNVGDWGSNLADALTQKASDGSYNHIIDVLSQFRTSTWTNFIAECKTAAVDASVIQTIESASASVINVNSFLGLNIADTPTLTGFSVVIPVLAIATQFINTKMLTSTSAAKKTDDPSAKTMSTMNNIMPFISGFMCLMLPIGIGIYWIAGSLFRIVQQFFVNRHMEKVDVEELRQKNLNKLEKKNQKREKMGLPTKSLSDVANTRTSTIDSGNDRSASKKKYEPKDYQSNENVNTNSISSIANMLNRKNDD